MLGSILPQTDDIDIFVNDWPSLFSFVLEKHAPLKDICISEWHCPLTCKDLKHLMSTWDRLKQLPPYLQEEPCRACIQKKLLPTSYWLLEVSVNGNAICFIWSLLVVDNTYLSSTFSWRPQFALSANALSDNLLQYIS